MRGFPIGSKIFHEILEQFQHLLALRETMLIPYSIGLARPMICLFRFSSVILLLVGARFPVAHAQQLAFELESPAGEMVRVSAAPSRSDSLSGNSLTCVCFLGTECPMARSYVSRLNELQRAYRNDGLRIVGVMSNRQDSADDVRNYVSSLNVQFEVAMDERNRVADQFGATRTPEVFLLDDQLKLRYHGRVDDQYAPSVARTTARREDLRIAIDELLSGKTVSVKETKAFGCVIGKYPPSGAQFEKNEITFTEHVFPVLQVHCMECHRSGEIGPFAMDRYEEVVGWAETMLETIDDGRMPPWHADRQHGDFSNERFMPHSDRELIRAWVAGGAKQGDPRNLVTVEPYDLGWQLEREPDLVLPMRDRPFIVPKDGVVEYQYFVVDPEFEADQWIAAAQVMPGSRDVVHHAIVFVRPPDGSRFQGVGWLTAYVPGQRLLPMPPGRARKVPAGSKLVFQMHYTPNGTEREDITRVGLLFANPSEITHSVFTLMAIDQEFEIPPETADHRVHATLPRLPSEGELMAVTPHMHYRGKSFQVTAELQTPADPPAKRTLLNVPRYDFNWQHTYQFREPIALSELRSVAFEAAFDNSEGNPFNPDPHQWVTWGDQTWEEMAVAFFQVSIPLNAVGDTPPLAAKENRAAQARIESYVERVFKNLDKNQDGIIQKSEGAIVVRHLNFDRWDLNGDGKATRDEVRQVAEQLHQ